MGDARYYLKSLFVAGFKSFSADCPQTFEFGTGLNMIHGPNGAGKSNVVDAISFALTVRERDLRVQRLRQLLHAKGERQDPSATVELCFAPKDGGGGDTQTLTARLFRDSDERRYKWQGRSKTQHEVRRCLRLIGIDMEQPSFLIYQNSIMGFHAKSPQELGALVFRASGGGRFAEAAADARKALESLQQAAARVGVALETARLNTAVDREEIQHLVRLNDIEAALDTHEFDMEVLRGCVALSAMREAARSRDELTDTEGRLRGALSEARLQQERCEAERAESERREKAHAADTLGPLRRKAEQGAREQGVVEDEVAECRKEAERARARAEKRRAQLETKRRALAVWKLNLASEEDREQVLGAECERLAAELESTEQGAASGHISTDALRGRLLQAKAELDKGEARARSAWEQRERTKAAAAQAAEELVGLRRRAAEAASRLGPGGLAHLAAARERIAGLRQEHGEVRQALADLDSEIGHAQAAVQQYGGQPLAPKVGFGPVHGVVQPRPEAEPWALALQVAGGGRWSCEVCPGAGEAKQVIAHAKRLGRTVTVWKLCDLPQGDERTAERQRRAKAEYGAVLPQELVRFEPRFAPAARKLFAGTVLADSDDKARDIATRIGVPAVSRGGLRCHAGGDRLTGGYRGGGAALLLAKLQLGQRVERRAELREREGQLKRRLQAEEQTVQRLGKDAAAAQDLEERSAEAERRAQEVGRVLGELERDAEMHQNQAAALAEQVALARQQCDIFATAGSAAQAAQQAVQQLRKALAAAQQKRAKSRKAAEKLRSEVQEGEEQLRGQVGGAEAPSQEEERQQQLDDAIARRDALAYALAAQRGQLEQEQAAAGRLAAAAAEARKASEEAKKAAAKLEAEHRSAKSRLDAAAAAHRKHSGAWEGVAERARGRAEEKVAEGGEAAEFQRSLEALDRLGTRHRAERAALLKLNIKRGRDTSHLEAELRRLAEWERKAATLRRAMELLQKAIGGAATTAAVDRISDAAFTAITRDSFQKYFNALIKTKRAEVVKEGPRLADGIRFEITPIGGGDKKEKAGAQVLSMLSGGQKTLLALAFVFSVASFRRSVFYALDEADAALDEQNQQRLAQLIRGIFAEDQVICISHHSAFQQQADIAFHLENQGGASVLTRTEVVDHGAKAAAGKRHRGA